MYIFKKNLGRIRKPSKRLQEIDPLATLTPAPPPKIRHQRQKQQVQTPVPSNFASRQIQGSQNRRAAAVLFTPHLQRQGAGLVSGHQLSPSPTLQRAIQPQQPLLSFSGSDSEVEESVRVGLERLNLAPQTSSDSQSPQAGPHSKQNPVPKQSKGGAKDVWTFFDKSGDKHVQCVLCKYVKFFLISM